MAHISQLTLTASNPFSWKRAAALFLNIWRFKRFWVASKIIKGPLTIALKNKVHMDDIWLPITASIYSILMNSGNPGKFMDHFFCSKSVMKLFFFTKAPVYSEYQRCLHIAAQVSRLRAPCKNTVYPGKYAHSCASFQLYHQLSSRGFLWFIYQYSPWLLLWHSGNHNMIVIGPVK